MDRRRPRAARLTDLPGGLARAAQQA
jgi:hypothetical protein